jgi:hypothetical protein
MKYFYTRKLLFLFCITFNGFLLSAGEFAYQSALDSIPKDGFYKILLIPEVISGLKSDYSDIRIFDKENNEIPYILTKESAIRNNSYFREYKILSNQNLSKPGVNQIILENPLSNPISELYIIVRNSAIEKEITLKGSDDLINWFIVSQQYPSVIGLFQDETSEIKVLDFPKSNFKYFMLQMSIKKEDPLQIIKVGNYDNKKEEGLYSNVPVLSVMQNDSSKYKKSYITIKFKSEFEISKIAFQVKGPKIYQRTFEIFNTHKNGNNISEEFVGEYALSAKTASVYELGTLRTNELLVTIVNDDNVPLKIEKVRCYQLNAYLIAQLHKNVKYFLKFGNANLTQPEYDLKYFTDSIPKNLMQVKPGIPEKIKSENQKNAVHSFFNNKIMWVVLILIIALLAYMTLKLTKEIK